MSEKDRQVAEAKLLKLKPAIRNYAWGNRQQLPEWLGETVADEPWAEAWYGAHPVASAVVTNDTSSTPLDQYLNAHAASPLPYLLKVLSIHRPLSIQVHPSPTAARFGFEAENQQGIAFSDPKRCYKDPNPKPECLVALEAVDALCGFRSYEDIAQTLSAWPEVSDPLPAFLPSPGGLRRWLEDYFDRPAQDRSAWLEALLSRLNSEHGEQNISLSSTQFSPEALLLYLHRQVDPSLRLDPGLIFAGLLNHVHLLPDQALFLSAGVPHAYLRGFGLELMTNSDNVLRAGLTTKHVDTDKLLQAVLYEAGRPAIIEPIASQDAATLEYPLPTARFALQKTKLDGSSKHTLSAQTHELCLVTDGNVTMKTPSADVAVEAQRGLSVSRGECGWVFEPSKVSIHSDREATVFRAYLPSIERCPTFRSATPTELRFGTSGLRGLVEDITDLETYLNVRGFLEFCIDQGHIAAGGRVGVAGDLRPSTHCSERSIVRAVCKAVDDCAMQAVFLGRVPSPALMLWGLHEVCPTVMVTGSHIPFDRNGIKFNTPFGEILKSDEEAIRASVARLRARIYVMPEKDSLFDDDGYFKQSIDADVPPHNDEAERLYRDRYLCAFDRQALAGLNIAFYEHSAVGRELLPQILESLGAVVHRIGRSESFVPVDTEAVNAEMVQRLQKLVEPLWAAGHRCDALVSTDGDSDRPLVMAVDERGQLQFIRGDILGLLVANALDARHAVVALSATDAIEAGFAGESVYRSRIGSPWVIASMQRLETDGCKGIVGWEANGGFLLHSAIETEEGQLASLATRDALLPMLVALQQVKKTGTSLVKWVERLPKRFPGAGLVDAVAPSMARQLLQCFGAYDPLIRQVLFGQDDSAELLLTTRRPMHFRGYEGEAVDTAAVDQIFWRRRVDWIEKTLAEPLEIGSLDTVDTLDGVRMRFVSHGASPVVIHLRASGNAPQFRAYVVTDSQTKTDALVSRLCDASDGLLLPWLDSPPSFGFTDAILRNIQTQQRMLKSAHSVEVLGIVSGTARAQDFWRQKLEIMRDDFGATQIASLHEDLPVNQGFGLLLMWQRLKEQGLAYRRALIGFVFGEGSRVAPFTEAEQGQKPAIQTFVRVFRQGAWAYESMVELALKSFAPVEGYLHRSGFQGLVVKWGDEVQLPTLDLSGADAGLAGADIVRFVSLQAMDEDTAANKDWVGIDADQNITRFIPRRPLDQMQSLAEQGLLQRQGDVLIGGVNLGSIAISYRLLDALLDEFSQEVNDVHVDRKQRPDLDPQLFTALTVAMMNDAAKRAEVWRLALDESEAMRRLEEQLPGVCERLRCVLDVVEQAKGEAVSMKVMDFGQQFWGDIGQHPKMYDFYRGLLRRDGVGDITRALAGIAQGFDAQGNIYVGEVQLGENVHVQNSVLVDVSIESGHITSSVLIGTQAQHVEATEAFDVQSEVHTLHLAARSGSYKLRCEQARLKAGERLTTVCIEDEDVLMRVHEDTDLRNKEQNYNQAILDNTLSFEEAHRKV